MKTTGTLWTKTLCALSALLLFLVDLIVNMRIAREIGLNLPFTVLGRATRILK